MSCRRAFPRFFPATLSLRQPFRPAAAPCQGLPKPPPSIACDAPAPARRRPFAALGRRLAAPVSLSLVSPSVRSRIKEEPGGPPSLGVASGSFSARTLGQPAPGKHRAARRLSRSVLRAPQPRQQFPKVSARRASPSPGRCHSLGDRAEQAPGLQSPMARRGASVRGAAKVPPTVPCRSRVSAKRRPGTLNRLGRTRDRCRCSATTGSGSSARTPANSSLGTPPPRACPTPSTRRRTRRAPHGSVGTPAPPSSPAACARTDTVTVPSPPPHESRRACRTRGYGRTIPVRMLVRRQPVHRRRLDAGVTK